MVVLWYSGRGDGGRELWDSGGSDGGRVAG